jgi:hypothetical protein
LKTGLLVALGVGRFILSAEQEVHMRELILYGDYSRAEVHEIFDRDSEFTLQAGTWGLQGIIQIPERTRDYVFFVVWTKAGHPPVRRRNHSGRRPALAISAQAAFS